MEWSPVRSQQRLRVHGEHFLKCALLLVAQFFNFSMKPPVDPAVHRHARELSDETIEEKTTQFINCVRLNAPQQLALPDMTVNLLIDESVCTGVLAWHSPAFRRRPRISQDVAALIGDNVVCAISVSRTQNDPAVVRPRLDD